MDNGTGMAKVQHYISRGVEVQGWKRSLLSVLADIWTSGHARLSCGEEPSSITIDVVLA
jgi:hypothetical protein